MQSQLTAGMIVTIYQDPITRQKPEGQATLQRFINMDCDGLERWMVHFIGDHASETYARFIDAKMARKEALRRQTKDRRSAVQVALHKAHQ